MYELVERFVVVVVTVVFSSYIIACLLKYIYSMYGIHTQGVFPQYYLSDCFNICFGVTMITFVSIRLMCTRTRLSADCKCSCSMPLLLLHFSLHLGCCHISVRMPGTVCALPLVQLLLQNCHAFVIKILLFVAIIN